MNVELRTLLSAWLLIAAVLAIFSLLPPCGTPASP